MSHTGFLRLSVALAVLVAGTTTAAAQEPRFDCESQRGSSNRAQHCEIREFTLGSVSSALNVDARPNGSISVIGSSRSDILVRARVTTHGDTDAQARQIAQQVQVSASPGQVSSSGPRAERGSSGWSVSFQVLVPTQTWMSLQSTNGSLSISDVEGEIDFRTTNGAVRLSNVGGQVKGATTNGALAIQLDGPSWLGPGLDVQTQNGAVEIAVPTGYSARLEASTRNGQIRSDIPLTVQGRIDNTVITDLGSGGPPVKVKTRNGGVRITERR